MKKNQKTGQLFFLCQRIAQNLHCFSSAIASETRDHPFHLYHPLILLLSKNVNPRSRLRGVLFARI